MDSPYKPGFGARPAVLVGRERQLARAEAVLTRVANSGEAGTSVVFTGARGLGKTVTLGVIGDRARARGFVVATVTLDRVSDNVQMLATAVGEAVAPLHRGERAGSAFWAKVKDRLGALSIEVNAGVVKIVTDAPDHTPRATVTVQRQVLADLLQNAARAAREREHHGLVLLLDEFQEPSVEELVVLANAIQDACKASATPLAIFAAGLPQTPELVMEAASFTERFDFRSLGRLDADAAQRALLEPALDLKVHWDTDAAELAVLQAGGSPYLIQLIGEEAWMQARPEAGTSIRRQHVEAAAVEVGDNLDNGMFRGRWAKATPVEKAVIVAIADSAGTDGVATTGDISTVLGVQARQWSMARQSLIDKGMIEPVGHGRLRFTMPGFAGFVAKVGAAGNGDPGQVAISPARPTLTPGHSDEPG